MFDKMKALIKKHWEIISYLVFGGLTTLVDTLVGLPFHYWLHWSGTASNTVAWIVAVLFAFLTNKPFVFKSNDWRPKTLFPELGKFVAARVISFLFSVAFMAVTVDRLHWDYLLMKVVVGVLVIIMNYIGSKLLVFRQKRGA